MSGHTPGPWHTDEPYFIYVWGPRMEMVADLPIGDEDAYLARMRGVGRGATEAEQRANARLIAAAPELLEAAKRLVLVASEDKPEEWAEATFALERAIAKAEGK